MDSFKCYPYQAGGHFFLPVELLVWGYGGSGGLAETIFKRFVCIGKMENGRHGGGHFCSSTFYSGECRIVVPAIRLLQWLTTSYSYRDNKKKKK